MELFQERILEDYMNTPSLRFLSKKYHLGSIKLKKYIIDGGGKINYKKGSTKNYGKNKTTFHKGQKAWNKGIEMGKSFSDMRSKLMKEIIAKGTWIAPSKNPASAKKISNSKKGEGNWMYGKQGPLCPVWQGGKSFEPYTHEFSKRLKIRIRERDNFICQVCGETGQVVHHIDYNKENCSEHNLITLCITCHTKTNFNRGYWINVFKEKMIQYV